MIPQFDYSARRAELEAELESALAELPGLRSTHQTVKTAAEDGAWRFQLFQQRLNVAIRCGADPASPALLDLLDLLEIERQNRNSADAVAETARRAVANCEWKIGALRLDLEQVATLEKPPPIVQKSVIN